MGSPYYFWSPSKLVNSTARDRAVLGTDALVAVPADLPTISGYALAVYVLLQSVSRALITQVF